MPLHNDPRRFFQSCNHRACSVTFQMNHSQYSWKACGAPFLPALIPLTIFCEPDMFLQIAFDFLRTLPDLRLRLAELSQNPQFVLKKFARRPAELFALNTRKGILAYGHPKRYLEALPNAFPNHLQQRSEPVCRALAEACLSSRA